MASTVNTETSSMRHFGAIGPKRLFLLLLVVLAYYSGNWVSHRTDLRSWINIVAETESAVVTTTRELPLYKKKSHTVISIPADEVYLNETNTSDTEFSTWRYHSQIHLTDSRVKLSLKTSPNEMYIVSWHALCNNSELTIWVMMSVNGANRWQRPRDYRFPSLSGTLNASTEVEQDTVRLSSVSRTCYTWQSSFKLTNRWSCSTLRERQPEFIISGNIQNSVTFKMSPVEAVVAKPRYILSIVTTVKNVGWQLREFLAYHVYVGVDHFFVYDDCSKDDTKDVLRPYIASGLVTHIDWCKYGTWAARQHLAKNDFVRRYSHLSEMILQADVDCYFYAYREKAGVKEPLDLVVELQSRFAEWKAGSLKVGSLLFGPNGRRNHSDHVIDSYTTRAKMSMYEQLHPFNGRTIDMTLSFAISDSLVCGESITHVWQTKPGTQFRKKVSNGWHHHILFNHYKVLSLQDYMHKSKSRTWSGAANCCDESGWASVAAPLSEVEDTQILDFFRKDLTKWFNYSPADLFSYSSRRWNPDAILNVSNQPE